jgi:phosphoglycolate phosphatase
MSDPRRRASTPPKDIRTVLFDLDGTLVDTGPDIARALNLLLRTEDREALPYASVRAVVSEGSTGLLRVAFGAAIAPPDLERLRTRFLALYRENLAHESKLFPGMEAVLGELERTGVVWGIVTNKLGWLTDPLLLALKLDVRAACVVSGDTTPHAKPHPAPLYHAAEILDLPTSACVYVGDSPRDIAAARAAGMLSLAALYGYIDSAQAPESWGADGLLPEPLALLGWLQAANRNGSA